MEPITIYLILSITVNILLLLLYHRQKELEQLHKQIIKSQKKQIELLNKIAELKQEVILSTMSECQLEIMKDITCQ